MISNYNLMNKIKVELTYPLLFIFSSLWIGIVGTLPPLPL